ncbi:hypothetical protein [Nonomuraea basaltis]|uniref:hypothetical protein n=1 Tax=Nonomuraea basaltis TaxID=2495887 RepID=UPI00110C5428|nr:hypothetical protein [Nonomuraea basaltis]TMR95076.1 hypothetical protein EJK15_30690 [Nonomuraea basaltis]
MNDIEETLCRTLGHAAEQAPRLPSTLPGQLATGYRRRRNRARAVLAATAVVVVAGGTTVGLRGGAIEAVSPATDPTGIPSAMISTAPQETLPPPIEQVWPEAVRKVSAEGPDGKEFTPLAFIDDRNVLVSTSAGFERTAALYAFDLDSREFRKIADTPIPAGTVTFSSDFTIGNGQVAWWTATSDARAHIYRAPLYGGEAELVTSLEITDQQDMGLGSLDVADDRIYFSEQEGGVYSVLLGGGRVEQVQNSAGMHVLSWPWIGRPRYLGESDGPRFGEIRNVETGETRTAVTRPGEKSVTCDLTYCSGIRSDGESFHRLRDGSQERTLPGDIPQLMPPALGRFSITTVRDERALLGVALHDLTTGTSADLGLRPRGKSISHPGFSRDNRLLSYAFGGEVVIVDLAKIR